MLVGLVAALKGTHAAMAKIEGLTVFGTRGDGAVGEVCVGAAPVPLRLGALAWQAGYTLGSSALPVRPRGWPLATQAHTRGHMHVRAARGGGAGV